MDDEYLYRQVAEAIRQDILSGKLMPGDRLPTVRELAQQRKCTVGTIQHAYSLLAKQGLVVSRAGQGTKVVDELPLTPNVLPLRRAGLVNRAEAFLLEVLTAGFSPGEVEDAFHLALDRWRVLDREQAQRGQNGPMENVLRFAGSHDMAINWLAAHFSEVVPGTTLEISFSGSLGGMIALAEGKADLAGSHLWDEESGEYNLPFVRRVLPGQKVALLALAHRRLGLVVPPGNPKGLVELKDLFKPGINFMNRQSGSGTRVWLDVSLHRLGLEPDKIMGYDREKMTHSAVVRAIAEGEADAGLALEASASAYGLDFILLTRERYDLIIPEKKLELGPIQTLVGWLSSAEGRATIASLSGYSTEETGDIRWVGE